MKNIHKKSNKIYKKSTKNLQKTTEKYQIYKLISRHSARYELVDLIFFNS